MRYRSRLYHVLIIVFLPFFATRAHAQDQEAAFEPLGNAIHGFTESLANGISPDGNVIFGQAKMDFAVAFKWHGADSVEVLTQHLSPDPFTGDPMGGDPTAVSRNGRVLVGSARETFTSTTGVTLLREQAVRWVDGALEPLGYLDDPSQGTVNSRAFDISADGRIIVGRSTFQANSSAFMWEDGVMTPIVLEGSTSSSAWAVSADGRVIVGNVFRSGEDRLFRWEAGAATFFGGNNIFDNVYDLSADGSVIVGQLDGEATRWVDGVPERLGVLGATSGGTSRSAATGVSGDGTTVVGNSTVETGAKVPFVWTEEDGMRRLSDVLAERGADLTGWTLNMRNRPLGVRVSDDGRVISGWGTNPNGEAEAYRATLSGGCVDPPPISWNRESGRFSNPDNWLDLEVPGEDSTALFDLATSYAVTFDGDQTNRRARFTHGLLDVTGAGRTYRLTGDCAGVSFSVEGGDDRSPALFVNDLAIEAVGDVNVGGPGSAVFGLFSESSLIVGADQDGEAGPGVLNVVGDIDSAWVGLDIGSDLETGNGARIDGFAGFGGFGRIDGEGYSWSSDGPVLIGELGLGKVRLFKEASFTGGVVRLGAGPEGIGKVTVAGDKTLWDQSGAGELVVGNGGEGVFDVTGGADVTQTAGTVTWVAKEAAAKGNVFVGGSGTTWKSGDELRVGFGDGAEGFFIVQDGAEASFVRSVVIGEQGADKADVQVTGQGARLDAAAQAGDAIAVGFQSEGALSVNVGGAVTSGQDVRVGMETGSVGDVFVVGSNTSGATLTVGRKLTVGDRGKGRLFVQSGGFVDAGDFAGESGQVVIGAEEGSDGTVLIENQTSELETSELMVGLRGRGILGVEDGGQLLVGNVSMGLLSASDGAIRVTGAGSYMNASTVVVGLEGEGRLGAADGGLIDVDTLVVGIGVSTAVLNAGGTITIGASPPQKAGKRAAEGTFVRALTLGKGAVVKADAVVMEEGGTLGGSAVLSLPITNTGVIAPGTAARPAATFTLDGDYAQTASGTFEAELGGSGAADVLDISGTAKLGGTLRLDLLEAPPSVGDTFEVLRAASITGTFDRIEPPVAATVKVAYEDDRVRVTVTSVSVSAEDPEEVLTTSYRLSEAYPNPFNPETHLALTLREPQDVTVAAYDLLGRRVAVLHRGLLPAGREQRLIFEASKLPSGLYVITVTGEHFRALRHVTLLK